MGHQPLSGSSLHSVSVSISTENAFTGLIIFLGRLLFAFIFLLSAPRLFSAQSASFAAQHGLPAASFLVPAAGILAGLGGLSILIGYRARFGAWAIVIFLVVVTPVMHNFWSAADPAAAQAQLTNFLKNLAMLGGALLITQFGAGPWSLDARRH